LYDLCPIEQVLHRVPEPTDVPWIVLHFEDDSVVLRSGNPERSLYIGLHEGAECCLSLFEGANDAVETRDSGHLCVIPGRRTDPSKKGQLRTVERNAVVGNLTTLKAHS